MSPGDPLELVRATLTGARAWLVGGALRDRALGSPALDLDLVVDGDPRAVARALAARERQRGRPAACFALSTDFGAWRVVGAAGRWQVDVEPLRGGSLEEDLAARDFTVNAVAEPIAGGPPIDPLGGLDDLAARRLRVASEAAFREDPLRVLRLVRLAIELDLEPDPSTLRLGRAGAPGLRLVSGERVFMELRRILRAPRAVHGLGLMGELGAGPVVLPEVYELQGVRQSRFHHLDVYGHTLETLQRTIDLHEDPGAIIPPEQAPAVSRLLDEPLADGLTRGQALRWGALLHDAAKPHTRAVTDSGRVTFVGHDLRGARIAREVLGRLRTSERLRGHVAGLVSHHLSAGFLVHEPQPLSDRTVFRYLRACEPVQADVTLLTVADRLATRGDGSARAIAAHMVVVHRLLPAALSWREAGPPRALLPGHELARELGLDPGPRLGELLEQLAEARYAGDIATREQALALARDLLDGSR